MASTPQPKTTINSLAAHAQRALIKRAAELVGKSRSDFMLEAACEKAQQVLLERTVFVLDAASFQRFNSLLDAPLDYRRSEALVRLLDRRAPWESPGR